MSNVNHLAVTPLGRTGIDLALGVRAGSWLFFTGHEATDFRSGLSASVLGKPGLPLGGIPRYRREGDYIIGRLRRLVEDEGSDMRHIVRVDQYYPSAGSVNAYQRARKALLKDFVPPSTSVLMEELLVEGAGMNVSWLAVLPGEGRKPEPAHPEGVPVPQHSGFNAALVYGDYVFVAGQMPNNDEMTGLAPAAYRPPNAV
jgi:enamine deaminase RidA (YjgF/YER057c/UK114 family)